MPRSPETRRDLLSAAGLAVLAVAYLLVNRSYPLDTLATPGPGILPLAAGLLMLGLAVVQALSALRARPPQTSIPQAESDGEATVSGRAIAMVVVLVAYAAAAGVIGFLTASFAAIVVSSRLLGGRGWFRPVVLALGVTVAAHLIFVVWLGVPFPTGFLR